MPEPTPAAELLTAAAALRSAVDDAPLCQHPGCGHYGGIHKVDGDGLTVCTDCDYDAHRYIGPGFEMPDGIGLPLAVWLDAVAAEMTSVDGTEYAYEEYPSWMAAVALARRINPALPEEPSL